MVVTCCDCASTTVGEYIAPICTDSTYTCIKSCPVLTSTSNSAQAIFLTSNWLHWWVDWFAGLLALTRTIWTSWSWVGGAMAPSHQHPSRKRLWGFAADDSYAACLCYSQPGRGNRPGKNPKYSGHSTGAMAWWWPRVVPMMVTCFSTVANLPTMEIVEILWLCSVWLEHLKQHTSKKCFNMYISICIYQYVYINIIYIYISIFLIYNYII